jgi:MoaA/NifB/PqqE/SkfB family radical SAM enzyme
MMSYLKLLSAGGSGQVIWAITNACNAKCRFCSYPRGKAGAVRAVDYPTAQRVLDVLAERNWKIISFTGGDPLLHPDLYRIIRYAADHGFVTRSGTNGWLLDEKAAYHLAWSGIRNFWISIDSEDPQKHEENRGLPGLFERLRKALPVLQRNGVRVNAAVPVNKLIGDYGRLLDFLRDLGLERVAFCYPMTTMDASYGGAADSELVDFTPEELKKVLTEIISLKKGPGRKRIINPIQGMEDIIRRQSGGKSAYPCLGGHKFFYLDWDLILYKCAFLQENYGSVLELGNREFAYSECDRCHWQCFRDPGVFYYPLVRTGRIVADLRQGRWSQALTALADSRNWKSLSAWADLALNGFYA